MGGDLPWNLQLLPQSTIPFSTCDFVFSWITKGNLRLPAASTLCAVNEVVSENPQGPCMVSSNPGVLAPGTSQLLIYCLQGEWGSPLACRSVSNPREIVLLGLVSGDPLSCGRVPLPNLYTRVSAFRDWIKSVTGV